MQTKRFILVEGFYLAVMLLTSLFYLFANFDKAISGQLGFAQLLFSIIVIVTFIVLVCRKKDGLPLAVYILYSIAQCVAVFFWIIYFDATFHIFPETVAINWLGMLIHVLLIAWGIVMIVLKKRSRTL